MAQFSWAAGADVLTGIAGAFGNWASASSNRILANARADAENTIRKAQNEQRASALSLAATVRSIADDAVLTNAGDAYGSLTELIGRTQEAAIRGRVEQGIRDSEQLGAAAARAAAAGVGGSSVYMISYSMRLQQARLAERMDEKADETTYELLKQRAGIMPAAVSRVDVSPLNPNLDYSQAYGATGSGQSLTSTLIQGLLSKRESLQVALDSISSDKAADATVYPTTGDFARMDRAMPITID